MSWVSAAPKLARAISRNKHVSGSWTSEQCVFLESVIEFIYEHRENVLPADSARYERSVWVDLIHAFCFLLGFWMKKKRITSKLSR